MLYHIIIELIINKTRIFYRNLGDRLAAGPGTLTPITEVRILLPQPVLHSHLKSFLNGKVCQIIRMGKDKINEKWM